MTQPPFWLKISGQYIIDNFEDLLKYCKLYDYHAPDESDDGDFNQTYIHLKAVADDYASQISNLRVFQKPEFNIPVEKLIRLLAAAILTAKKMGIDDHHLMAALVNIMVLNNRNISHHVERQYFEIVKNCIRQRPFKKLLFSWTDIEDGKFMTGAFENKLAKTEFLSTPETASDSPLYLYEGNGMLMLDNKSLSLVNINHQSFKRMQHALKTEITTALNFDVKGLNSTPCSTIDKMLSDYQLIEAEFENMRPSTPPALKIYSDTESFFVRVVRCFGIKIEAETIDPAYEHEQGNVFIDAQVGLIPKEFIFKSLQPGDILPVKRNKRDRDNLPFRIDLQWIAEYINAYAKDCIDNDIDIKAMALERINGGQRWLSQDGFSVNVFDYDINQADASEDVALAVNKSLPCTLRVHSTVFDNNGNCLVKGMFVNVDTAAEPVDIETFKSSAYSNLINDILFDLRDSVPESAKKPEAIEPGYIHLLAILSYQLAAKMCRGDSFGRIRHLVAALLLTKVIGNNEEAAFIRSQIDYQKSVIMFAKGQSPAALPDLHQPDIDLPVLHAQKHIVETLRNYKEDTNDTVDFSIAFFDDNYLGVTASVVSQLISASNSLVDKIDRSEINRIKKSICAHLDVADQYRNIYNEVTNYGVESEFLEFKASCALPPENLQSSSLAKDIAYQRCTILKTVCAFLNSISGGELLIGVADSGFAIGIQHDLKLLHQEHLITEPTADRLRTYLKLFIDKAFITADRRTEGIAITAPHIQYVIERNNENLEIIRIKVSPYPWDVVKLNVPDLPADFHNAYVRTSGASTPLNSSAARAIKLRKLNALDPNQYKTAEILKAIDDKTVVDIINYCDENGPASRRLEPFAMLFGRNAFLAYDISRRDVVMCKLSRFKDTDLKLTAEKWRNEKKHCRRRLDVFDCLESESCPVQHVTLWLSPYARAVFDEECELKARPGSQADTDMMLPHKISANTGSGSQEFPWVLDADINGFRGIGRFILGLPGNVRVIDNPPLTAYLSDARKL